MAYQALSDEIDRITSSPYPSQLRTLRDLTSNSAAADIEQWAAAKPCLVDPLASCLLAGLQHWSYVLEIVTKFSLNLACRDAFLHQQPSLLHSVVVQAVQPVEGRSKYVRASVVLLSKPLPDTIALPAEAQILFIQLFEAAAKKPIASTIEPIYLVLSGTGGLLLGLLSDSTLVQFEDCILDILRHSAGTPDGYVGLYCLCIMKMVCASTNPDFRLDNSSYNAQDFLASTPNSSRWKAQGMQQFFAGDKAQKSTQLAVLTVLGATSQSAKKETYAERLKSMLHANEIISAIPADLKSIWCKGNPVMIRKLQERLCEDLDDTMKTIALRFVGKLCELDSLPHPVLESLESTFVDIKSVLTAHVLCRSVDDSDLLSNVLARAPISLLLENALEYAIRADSPQLASGAEAITHMVSSARTVIGAQKIAGHQVREVLNARSFIANLHTLLDILKQQVDTDHQHGSTGWCQKALRRTRCRLAQEISTLLLHASRSTAFDPLLLMDLLDLHAVSARGDIACSHDRPDGRDALAIARSDDSITTDDHIDWREALKTHFDVRAHVEQDAVSRVFAKACASLEARCENVEQPLREEQQKRQAIEHQYSELTHLYEELESRHVNLTVQHRSAKEESHQLARERDASLNENSKLLERVSQLEHKVRAAEASATKQMQELKETMNMSELGAAAKIAQKQAALEDAQEDAEAWEAKYNHQVTQVATLEHQLESAKLESERHQQHLSKTKQRVQELESALGAADADMEQLKSKIESLDNDLHTVNRSHAGAEQQFVELNSQLLQCQSERDNLQHQIDEETRRFNEELNQKRHELDLRTVQHEQSIEESRSELATAQEQLRQLAETKAKEITSLEHKITDLKKRIDRYQRKCEEKDQQIAEANAMRTNLMAAMGISGGGGLPRASSLPHRSRDSIVPQTQMQATAALADTEMDIDSQQLADQSFVSNVSSPESRTGPTPKRCRPRKSLSFAAPATNTTTKARANGAGLRTSRTSIAERRSLGGAVARQALLPLSGNHRASMPAALKSPGKVAFVQEEVGDETTFEGSEIFDGTQVDLQE